MAASAPALFPLERFSLGTPYTIVNNIVFKKLAHLDVIRKAVCHLVPVKDLRAEQQFLWLSEADTLRCIQLSKEAIEELSGFDLKFAATFPSLHPFIIIHIWQSGYIHEGRCVVSLVQGAKIFGYNNGTDKAEWVDFEEIDFDEQVNWMDFGRLKHCAET